MTSGISDERLIELMGEASRDGSAKWVLRFARLVESEALGERGKESLDNGELLAALKACMGAIDAAHDEGMPGSLPSKNWHWFNSARAAIAKAESEASPGNIEPAPSTGDWRGGTPTWGALVEIAERLGEPEIADALQRAAGRHQ